MRRFCNYFVTLFNQEKIIPFGQFINATLLNGLKQKVKDQMANYAKTGLVAELHIEKPPEEPEEAPLVAAEPEETQPDVPEERSYREEPRI